MSAQTRTRGLPAAWGDRQRPSRLRATSSSPLDAGEASGASPLAGFLLALFTSGEPVVGPFKEPVKTVPAEAAQLLCEEEARERAELAGASPAPEYLPAVAEWAAVQFYHACQFLVDRAVDAATVQRVLSAPGPAARSAAVEYNVDLVFRYLPDLLRLAEQRAPGDALTEVLRGWARAWPLSSVGVVIEPATPPGAFWAEPALRRLYLDRVWARSAKDRLADPAVRALIEADAGPYREFAGGLAAALPLAPVAPIRAAPALTTFSTPSTPL